MIYNFRFWLMFIGILFVEILLGLSRKHIPPERFEDCFRVCFCQTLQCYSLLGTYVTWLFSSEHVGIINQILNMFKGRFMFTNSQSYYKSFSQFSDYTDPILCHLHIRIYSFPITLLPNGQPVKGPDFLLGMTPFQLPA